MTPSKSQSLLERTQSLLRSSGLKARKNLGQNFLIDEGTLDLILETASIQPEDTVIEVGPGLGTLTSELCRRAGKVVAVELDDHLAAGLKKNLTDCDNLTVLNQDILKILPEEILAAAGLDPAAGYSVVANLPYYITSPVLRHFLEADHTPQRMVVMVQKEVANEIAALPGKMSLLSIGIQLYGEPEIAGYVTADCFYPPPNVESAILKVTPRDEMPVDIPDTKSFFTFVKAGFSLARKQLPNSLSSGLGIDKTYAKYLIEKVGIDPKRRAETLTIEEWASLWQLYEKEAWS